MLVDNAVLPIIAYPYISKNIRTMSEKDFILSISFDGRICFPSVARGIMLYAIKQGYLIRIYDELLKVNFEVNDVKVPWVFQTRDLKIFNNQVSVDTKILSNEDNEEISNSSPKDDSALLTKKRNQRKRKSNEYNNTLLNYF
ncbi:MAG: DUF2240 family protein [Candidatus Asgardarchaeia archaeon]